MMKPMTHEELRVAYQASIRELLEWISEHMKSDGDTYGRGSVHFLSNGRLVLGVPGFDEYEYERVLYLWPEPKGWVHTYEGLTLWVSHLQDFYDEESNSLLLHTSIGRALNALDGGSCLTELRQYQTRLNAIRAVKAAQLVINNMPEHLRPVTELVVQVYENGNVVLNIYPSAEASRELQHEVLQSRPNHKLVFGTYGQELLRTVTLGGQHDQWTRRDWASAVGKIMTTED
ncbi:MAG TPA: hypothetical protein PLB89_01765 [Flavobacteriales bacterium]|nr:hypothetical protein [Flavobacteriales bacterium]